MGMDAVFFIQLRAGANADDLMDGIYHPKLWTWRRAYLRPPRCDFGGIPHDEPLSADFLTLDPDMGRFYNEHYPRGPWYDYAAFLMQLLAHPDVEKVWYTDDGVDLDDVVGHRSFSEEDLFRITRHYLLHRRDSDRKDST